MVPKQRLYVVVFLAISAFVASVASVSFHPDRAARAAGVQITAPCVPNIGAAGGILPSPPEVFPANVPGKTITLNVLQGPSAGTIQRYCYTLAGAPAQYVEAPTIVVHQGETFRLALIDRIPPTKGDSSMPMPQATTPDGCALLGDDPSMPAPNATPAYLGRQRVFASPPPMMANDTNFHTHGWHVDPDVDNVFKSLSASKNGTCSYAFAVPLTQPAGTYWYHAHMHGVAQQQVGGGLAGALVVLPATPAPSLPERVILIKNSIYQIDKAPANRERQFKAALAQGNPGAKTLPSPPPHFDPYNPPSWPSGWAITTPAYCPQPGSGAFMSHWMVNGYPVGDPEVHVKPALAPLQPGARMLYRIIDATSDSFANIKLLDAQGQPEKLDVVGRDGVPVDPSGNPEGLAALFENVLLPPAGRVDIVVTGSSAPQTLIADNVCTGYLGEAIPRRTLLTIAPSLAKGPALKMAVRAVPIAHAGQTAADRFYAMKDKLIVRRRALTFTQYSPGNGVNMAWYVTDTSSGANFVEKPFWLSSPAPGDHDYLPTIRVPQNSVEEWDLIDATGEVHAFHIHQLTFVTDSNPFEGPHLHVFQDTVALKAAEVDPTKPKNGDYPFLKPTITRITIDFRHVHKGTFVYHCHMLFHEDHGMMGIIQVY